MNPMRLLAKTTTSAAAAALLASALLVPAAANAAPILAEDAASSTCTVTGGELSWGVKESFRSYISGSIANGSWEVADGATYETPLFGWSNPTGEIDADTGEGLISFTGSIHFTGHDGVLDMTLANPSIELKGDGTARLLLDTKSNDAQGQLKLDEQQATLAKIEGVDAFDPASGQYSFSDASAVLTSEGATAFGDFYGSGDEVDPVTLTVQLAPCEGAAAADQPADEEPVIAPAPEPAEQSVPWLPIIIGGVALIVIGVTVGMLIAGRKKKPATGDDAAGEDPPTPAV